MSENLRGYDAWKTTEPLDRWEEPETEDEEADDVANEDDGGDY